MSFINTLKPAFWIILILAIACQEQSGDSETLTEAQRIRQTGLEYLDQNELQKAEDQFINLIELAPEEIMGYANLGIVYLRQGEFDKAEEYFKKALEIAPENVIVRLNLFEAYQQMGQQELAETQLQKVLEYDPENLFALYNLTEMSPDGEQLSLTSLISYLERMISIAPTNIVPRVYLLEHLLENRKYDQALEQFEEIQSKFERLPEETQQSFDQAYQKLQNSPGEDAYTALLMFHNQLKLTSWYQSDVRALRGSQFSQVGIPVISFSRKMTGYSNEDDAKIYKYINFSEVAANAGLTSDTKLANKAEDLRGSKIAVHDLDNDGDQDLFMGMRDSNGKGDVLLFSNELGRFDDAFNGAGIEDTNGLIDVKFADYDNDGFLDLFILAEDGVKLYRNIDAFKYQDVTEETGFDEINMGVVLELFDADHDGDLDLFIGVQGFDKLYRNNGDKSFTDVSEQAGIGGSGGSTNGIVFGDFDDDGDTDFFTVSSQGNRLFTNERMGVFSDITNSSGLDSTDASNSVSSGDYNNDGLIDLIISDYKGTYKLYQGQGRKGFSEVKGFSIIKGLDEIKPLTHEFFDYDNDGHIDLVVAGEPIDQGKSGLVLLRNQKDGFENVTDISMKEVVSPVQSLSIGDYNEDNDLDLFVSFKDGDIGLLRNDGGNMNYQLKIQLVGLRQGSGKNNYFGIGSKVEVRSGSLYQMRTITSPNEYFGLGARERADILRVRWTNGVPQNIFAPHSDLDLIEQQKLKGSCPFLYTWNGDEYVFVKDMMWRSALGMPLGIMTSDQTQAYAFSDASREYLKIPGEVLQVDGNQYKIKITGELWETIYLDELKLFAVDHPANVDFRLDEKFVPPPFPELKLYPIKKRNYPVSVTDGKSDHLDKILAKDNIYISNLKKSDYQGVTELHDLIIDLGIGTSTEKLHLFMNGWIFPSDASINMAMGQSTKKTVVPPLLQVRNEDGEWQTVIENLGFPLGKNKTVVTDLSKIFLTKDRKLRIRTSMQIYWDHIFFSSVNTKFDGHITEVHNNRADLSYRGFSAEYRKGGRYGPHWFDYQNTSVEPQWMDLEGYYTRYGDVKTLLSDADDQYIIYNAGDEVSLDYSLDGLPTLQEGWKRDFVIYSVGWVKDGDLNTAHGQTVAPLPYHNMPSYPYPDTESYPYQENADYIRSYNTRRVDDKGLRDLLKVAN